MCSAQVSVQCAGLLSPESTDHPLRPQLAKPTWRISPYPHQESDHHHHTYRQEGTQHMTQCTYAQVKSIM